MATYAVRHARARIVSCSCRAAERGHEDVEPAAHELLQYLDEARR